MKAKLILLFLVSFSACKQKTISPDTAIYHEGEVITVCGKVTGTFVSKNENIILKFNTPLPKPDFTAVIMAKDTAGFKDYDPAEYFKKKEICVKGRVKLFQGKAAIMITSPDQITIQ